MKRHVLFLSLSLSLSLSLALSMAAGTAWGEDGNIESSVGRGHAGLYAGARATSMWETRSDTRIMPHYARNTVIARDHNRNLQVGLSYFVEHENHSMGGHFTQGTLADETYLNYVQIETVGEQPRIDLSGGATLQGGSVRSQHKLKLRMNSGESRMRSISRVDRSDWR